MLGAALALRLRAQGHRVTLIESAPSVGGLASAQSVGDIRWDRFYHVILLSDSHLRGLLEEIGLADQLKWGTTRTGFYIDGHLYSLSSSLEFLQFSPLSFIDKLRLGWTILHASRISDGAPLERLTATKWLARHSGKRTFERIWRPLLRAKLGEHYDKASAAFIWAIIARMYAARRSGLKREMFGYVDGGYDRILPRVHATLESRGVEVLCGRPATSVVAGSAMVEVHLAGGDTLAFDDAVLTVPCRVVASLCPQLTAAERDRLSRVLYQGVICPSLLLARPLADYYVTNITESWVPFTAVIEMTALVDPATFGGRSLVYLPRYLPQDDPTWRRSNADIVEESLGALERMYPNFRRSDVIASEVARARDVLAVPTLDYSRTLRPPLETSVPHVYVVNSAQISNGTLNVNETLALAAEQSAALAPLLAQPHGAAA
jgi:protoporphyrinogen oxidase